MSEVLPAERHAALAVASRQRLLAVLRATDQPMDVASLADAIGLHLTTTRFHLEVLEEAGLVARTVEREGRPGRPRQLYNLVENPNTGSGMSAARRSESSARYLDLAGVLAEALAVEPGGPSRRAEAAGRRWAVAQVPPDSLTWDDAGARVVAVFDRLGFEPRLVDDDDGRHVEFAACPFRELARAHPEVVCAVHLGLLRGALDRLDVAGPDRAMLRPFVGVDLCVADLPHPSGEVSSDSSC